MPLAPGTRLGPYQIEAPIGAGGMGEVYRARDTRLDRIVAIKVLPPHLAADPQFRERFGREAKTISSLNHPNICILYDIGRDQGHEFLVLEYLEGETLGARIAKGPLPLGEALKIAVEISSALDRAHRQGIVHRDLKPGNVMLTKAGSKLLDFGLAKSGGSLAGVPASELPTGVAPLTREGTILGTFQYMSPEQIEGQEADPRSDIFAFGAMLFEMLTGKKAFSGKSHASLLGAIMKEDPPPVSQVQPLTPPALDYLIRTCLAKDPDARYQTAHDIWLQLRWIGEGGSAAGVPAPVVSRRKSRERLAWTAAAVLGVIALSAGVLAVIHLREKPAPADPVQFTVAPEENATLGPVPMLAVSPDGRQLVFRAVNKAGAFELWVRSLATPAARTLPGTEGASYPFWSPDGRYIGFWASGKLRKIDAAGGPPIALCDATIVGGGAWNRDNVIVFAPTTSGPLVRVDAAGGIPTPVTRLGPGETYHLWPSFLPDGRHFLYLVQRGSDHELRVASLDSAETASLGPVESNAIYASGHLLFSRGGTLMAQPFDPSARRTTGDPFPMAEHVGVARGSRALFSVSATGVLAYVHGGELAMSQLTWIDRTGKPLGVIGDAGAYSNLSLSPDEKHVAVSMGAGSPTNRDIWLIDLARDATASRLTFDPANEGDPIWSPDGSQVLFNTTRNGNFNSAYQHAADGGGQDVPVVKVEGLVEAMDWSHDGRFLLFDGSTGSNRGLWMLPMSGERKPEPFLRTAFVEDSAAFSPDDRWVAYDSNASGRFEVYVRSFAPGGGQFQISRNGGWAPRWRGDGKEIFFLALDGTMMAADVTLGNTVQAAVPRALFPTTLSKTQNKHTYTVTKDGKRFLLVVPEQHQVVTPISVVVNWPSLAKK